MHATKHHAIVVACEGKVVAEITVMGEGGSPKGEAQRLFDELFSAAKFEAYRPLSDLNLPPLDGASLLHGEADAVEAAEAVQMALESMRYAAEACERSCGVSVKGQQVRKHLWAARTNAEIVLEHLKAAA